ncbi:MAG: NAD(P)-binding domain-containing protein [Deltaproteobacteria bacterium]|nr:NAD(P)-binding domain-containing protein [Deltaproteobacteria bacterium]
MKIGIVGSGGVAQTLGAGFLKHGHEVMLGTRSPASLDDWRKENGKAKVGSNADAAKFGELLVLAAKGAAAVDSLKLAGAANLAGKTVIDTCNPIDEKKPPVNGVLAYFTGPNESLMERLQKEFPEAKFVKCFNSVGGPFMVNPSFQGGRPSMFICGNDEGAKKQVGGILEQFGWETADMGKVEAARAIEPLCMLWCIPGIAKNDWSPRAFKLLK